MTVPVAQGQTRLPRWLAAALWLAAQACGPSFEAIQEGDLRFAHCDRLDLDPNIAPSHRLHCWREWRRVYTYGQTRDRVQYAQRRIAEVVSGDTEPSFDLPAAAERDPGQALPRVGDPGSGSRSVQGATQVSIGPALAPQPNASTVSEDCRSRCEEAQVACAPGCETRPTGCQPCPSSLEDCLRDCPVNP